MESLLRISLALFIGLVCSSTAQAGLVCWRCQNGYKSSKICEKGPLEGNKDKGKGSQAEVKEITYNNVETAPENGTKVRIECKTLQEFFTKQSIVTAEWTKRSLAKKAKGRSAMDAVVPEEPFCATITVYATNIETGPQVYRDCIRGSRDDIIYEFESILEVEGFELKGEPGTEVAECQEKKVGSEHGTKRITICLCNTDKCNNKAANGVFAVLPSRIISLLGFLFAITTTFKSQIL